MPNSLSRVGRLLMFAAAAEPDTQQQAWQSDGTESGTRALAKASQAGRQAFPSRFTRVGEHVVFVALDSAGSERLWALQPSGDIALLGQAAELIK
jgi:ELWxxDGT repeat protein